MCRGIVKFETQTFKFSFICNHQEENLSHQLAKQLQRQ